MADRDTMRAIWSGILIISLFSSAFIGWAVFAPLESAAIAPGVVSVEGSRKTVQHLEGGIVAELLVRDGDPVEAGQILIRLDDTQARASHDLLHGRYVAALALGARLVAERDGSADIGFGKTLEAMLPDTKVTEAMLIQRNIFRARRETLAAQTAILNQRVAQFSEEIGGLRDEIGSQEKQMHLLGEEIQDVALLLKDGLARKPRLLALQRQLAEIEGARHKNVAQIARAEQGISEAHLRISALRTTQINEAVEMLREVQTEILEMTERLSAARDVLRRTEIRAPRSGTVVGLRIHTTGGVVVPREPILDIVPAESGLVIEAQVNPDDIDVVHVGLSAQVLLTALNQRATKPLMGNVTNISADRLVEERTGRAYFLVRVNVGEEAVKAAPGLSLSPGMQAEVLILTGARTALDYLLEPITRSIRRAFRET